MKSIFQYKSYKKFIVERQSSLPNKGRGDSRRLAEYLNVHTTFISQVLKGDKEFSQEQAIKVASYYTLSEEETHYLILLVNLAKSGTKDLKDYYSGLIQSKQNKYYQVQSRMKKAIELSDDQKAQYYSDWKFMAVWLATSIDQIKNIDEIASKLDIEKTVVRKILDFLLQVGLCEEKKGHYVQGISKTHLSRKSLLINKHHTNWRLKAIEKGEQMGAEELQFSAPLTISKKDFKKIKAIMLDSIERSSEIVSQTHPTEVACLNIDFFYL
jgi:uncharacterized protein (TIGR02147 family)